MLQDINDESSDEILQSYGISQDIIDRMLWHIQDIIDRIIVLEVAGISLALGEGWSTPFHSLEELPNFKRAQQPACKTPEMCQRYRNLVLFQHLRP